MTHNVDCTRDVHCTARAPSRDAMGKNAMGKDATKKGEKSKKPAGSDRHAGR